jgi:hypothetical protein
MVVCNRNYGNFGGLVGFSIFECGCIRQALFVSIVIKGKNQSIGSGMYHKINRAVPVFSLLVREVPFIEW